MSLKFPILTVIALIFTFSVPAIADHDSQRDLVECISEQAVRIDPNELRLAKIAKHLAEVQSFMFGELKKKGLIQHGISMTNSMDENNIQIGLVVDEHGKFLGISYDKIVVKGEKEVPRIFSIQDLNRAPIVLDTLKKKPSARFHGTKLNENGGLMKIVYITDANAGTYAEKTVKIQKRTDGKFEIVSPSEGNKLVKRAHADIWYSLGFGWNAGVKNLELL